MKLCYQPLLGRPEGIYWYVLQTFSAATIAFNRFKKRAKPLIIESNKNELRCTLENGANIFFKSGWDFENLRMETLDGCIVDEFRLQSPDLWTNIIRPMLARRKGWCDFLSTTNGYDHFYDLWNFALEHPDEWATFHAPSTEAWWWTPEEIASAKASMTDDEFAQEILAEFREIGKGKAYKKHSVRNQSEQNPFAVTGLEWSPYLPIIVGCDFNVGIMVWELMQKKGYDFHVGDEIAMENTDTDDMAKVLVERVRNHPPGVIIIGDASGKSRKTSAAGATDYSIIMQALKAANIPAKNLTPESNPMIKDRLNIVNGRLLSADGFIHCTYNPRKCKRLKMDLERVVTKAGSDGVSLDKSNALLTHSSDAFGYPLCYYSKEWKEKPSTLRVIER